jgi:capsular exopolysaccharide synthesis family protein
MSANNNIWEPNATANTIDANYGMKPQVTRNAMDIDFRRIVATWPFMILFALLGYAIGNIYLRYTTPIYTVSTSISLEQKDEMSLGQALLVNPRDPFNDKVAYFKSPAMAAVIVDSLGLQYNAQAQGRFKNKNFYNIIKWYILPTNGEEIPEINFTITPTPTGFHFVSGSVQGDGFWGIPFNIKKIKLVVEKLQDFAGQSPIYCFNQNRLSVAFELSNNIAVNATPSSNIITIRYANSSDAKAIDILKAIVYYFNKDVNRDKSQTFSQAISFIDQRLEPLRNELDSIESSLAQFKASRGMVGSSSSAENYVLKAQNYDQELTKLSILESTINSVETYLNNPKVKDPDISFVGLENSGLPSMLSQYQQMRMERDKLALTAQATNPNLILVNKNLKDLRDAMDAQLQKYKQNLRIAQTTYEDKMASANSIIRNAPLAERELIDKTRFQNIKEALYLSLLQKREEAAIAKASLTVNTKVLFPPLKSTASVAPSKKTILSIAILIGLFLPVIFSILKEVLNKKIISKKQLQSMTTIPVIGELEQTDNQEGLPFIIGSNKRSMFGEQIRSLRTNINFYLLQNNTTNYIMLTSSVSGEGKTFLSTNLAKSYSLQGKRVALLEFDLRRPKISKTFKLPTDILGLSSMLIGKVSPQDIIVNLEKDTDQVFDLFPAGAVPPNPQELFSGKYINQLKEYLDANYDIVVIDTPPYGIVADAQILGQWADVTMIVTRFHQTVKEQIQEINEWNDKGFFKSLALIFNGVKNKGYFGYKYGYYYYKRKYGYSYYSYSSDDKKGS